MIIKTKTTTRSTNPYMGELATRITWVIKLSKGKKRSTTRNNSEMCPMQFSSTGGEHYHLHFTSFHSRTYSCTHTYTYPTAHTHTHTQTHKNTHTYSHTQKPKIGRRKTGVNKGISLKEK